ncbi:MAG: chemotaxis protein CheB [Candidatus Woesearchaeota archaeon]
MRVLLVDDSSFYGSSLQSVLSSYMEVVCVQTADACLHKIHDSFDIVLLDIHLEGIEAPELIPKILRSMPQQKIVVMSSSEASSSVVFMCLMKGALDFIPKQSIHLDAIAPLVAQLSMYADAKVVTHGSGAMMGHQPKGRDKLLCIASSTGGPAALEVLLAQLPASFAHPIVIVQHIIPSFVEALHKRLQEVCCLPISVCAPNQELVGGHIYLIPQGVHAYVVDKGRIALRKETAQHGVMPSANPLFASAAYVYKEAVIGVVLTGMGQDGLEGSRVIKQFYGTIIVQDKQSSVIYGMPKEVAQAHLADMEVSIQRMGTAIEQVVGL